MSDKVMISLSGRNQNWFNGLSKKEQSTYLKTHPKSKFGPGAKPKAKPKAGAKPAAKKAAVKAKPKAGAKPATKKAGVKKKVVVSIGAKKAATKAKPKAGAKPVAKKTAAKKPAVKKAAPKTATKKPAVKRKKPEIKVHSNTDKLHDEAMKQKKASIDKVIAPYARELGQLRNKRDGGGGLSQHEAARYKQLIQTITKLHAGRNG